MAMTCFSLLNPRIGKRLTRRTEPHSCASFTITLALIRMAGHGFGLNGSRLVHSDKKRCEAHRTPKAQRAKFAERPICFRPAAAVVSECARVLASRLIV